MVKFNSKKYGKCAVVKASVNVEIITMYLDPRYGDLVVTWADNVQEIDDGVEPDPQFYHFLAEAMIEIDLESIFSLFADCLLSGDSTQIEAAIRLANELRRPEDDPNLKMVWDGAYRTIIMRTIRALNSGVALSPEFMLDRDAVSEFEEDVKNM